MKRYLILIRHAGVEIVPETPASRWHLSKAGRMDAAALADKLRSYQLKVVFTSREFKAVETGQAAAAPLGLPTLAVAGLQEQSRDKTPYFSSDSEFKSAVKSVLENPDEPGFGEETGTQALVRFSAAIDRLLHAQAGEDLCIVSHGTVISLFAGKITGKSAAQIWDGLGMADGLVLPLVETDGAWHFTGEMSAL